jgi:MFS family permease
MKPEGWENSKKAFYGWWIIVASAVGLFMSYIPISGHTFSVFFESLSREFKWSRAEISLGFSLSLLVMTGAFPLIGRLVDRFSARAVIVPSVLIFGLSLISFYFLSAHLWHFYVVYSIMGIVGGGTGTAPYFRVISQWFDKKRGLALGLAAVGYGLGSFIMPSLAHVLITAVGWRVAYVLIGFMVMVVTIPVVSLLLKERPQRLGLQPDGELIARAGGEKKAAGMSGREALHTGTFWLISSAILLMSMGASGCLIHLVPMLRDRGVSAQSAAFAASLLGGAHLLGRLGTGYLLDRFFASSVAVCFFGGAAVGILLLWNGVADSLAFVAAVLLGLGVGAEGDIVGYLVSRYFGLRAFGEIYSYILITYTVGGMIGPLLMGVGFDTLGSYRLVLGLFLLATLTAAALMARLGPYRISETAVQAAPTSSPLDSMTGK